MKDVTQKDSSIAGLTLVLGGTGKTGRRVAHQLKNRGVQTRIASPLRRSAL